MSGNKRTNFYGGSVSPRHKEQALDEGLFWPTDEEFRVIFDTLFGRSYYGLLLESYSKDEAAKIRVHFSDRDYYTWFVENFQIFVEGYSRAVTEELVLAALKLWIEEKVKPVFG